MDKQKPYSAKRWTDIPKPIVSEDTREFTEDEKTKYDQDMEYMLRKYGVLKPGETLK